MAQLQQLLDTPAVDPAHPAGVAVINTIQHPDRLGGQIIATADTDPRVVHGRVHQPHGQLAFNVGAQAANGFHHQRQMVIGRNPKPAGEGGFQAGIIQPRLDLRAATKGHHQSHTQAAKQGDVVDDINKIAVLYGIAGHGQHHRAPAMGVDVR